MLRATKDRKRKYVNLGISENPENWDFSKNQPKAECPNREYIELLIADKLKEYSAQAEKRHRESPADPLAGNHE